MTIFSQRNSGLNGLVIVKMGAGIGRLLCKREQEDLNKAPMPRSNLIA